MNEMYYYECPKCKMEWSADHPSTKCECGQELTDENRYKQIKVLVPFKAKNITINFD